MTILFIPLIPILIGALAGATVVTAVWYGNLTPEEKERENKDLARRLGGKKFNDNNDDQKKLV